MNRRKFLKAFAIGAAAAIAVPGAVIAAVKAAGKPKALSVTLLRQKAVYHKSARDIDKMIMQHYNVKLLETIRSPMWTDTLQVKNPGESKPRGKLISFNFYKPEKETKP